MGAWDIRCLWCFVVGVLLGQKGPVFSTHTLTSQTHLAGKVSATATYSCKNKHDARSLINSTQVKIVVVVLTKNWCLIGS